jgi:hypothetical protein
MIKLELKEVGCNSIDWIYLAQESDQWHPFCEQGDEPSTSRRLLEMLQYMTGPSTYLEGLDSVRLARAVQCLAPKYGVVISVPE